MLDSLINFVTVLLALSIASERLVEIIKGWSPRLYVTATNPAAERVRQLRVHLISLVTSALAVYLMQHYVIEALNLKPASPPAWLPLGTLTWIAFSVLASGGSSAWNSILTYLLSLKNLKRQEVKANEDQQARAALAGLPVNGDLEGKLPAAMPQI